MGHHQHIKTTELPQTGQAVLPVAHSIRPSAKQPLDSVLARLSDEDRSLLDRILTEPIEYLDHPSFSRARTAKELFGIAAACAAQPWTNSAEAAAPATASTTGATLSNVQEQRLFLKMNYARFRMARLLATFAGKRLTGKAVHELLFWQKQTVATRCEIVQANVPLVLAMAKRTRMGNIDYAELISEGNMALLRSVDKFDCGRGFKFSTYACRAILKSFSRVALKSNRYRGRFPTEFDPSLEKSHHAELVREQLEVDCVDELRDILAKNLADLSEVEATVIRARFALVQRAAAVEAAAPQIAASEPGGVASERVGASSDAMTADAIGGAARIVVGDGATATDGVPATTDGLAALPEPQTLEQVGLMIGVTKERVRQIQNRALAKLRSKLQDDFLAA